MYEKSNNLSVAQSVCRITAEKNQTKKCSKVLLHCRKIKTAFFCNYMRNALSHYIHNSENNRYIN